MTWQPRNFTLLSLFVQICLCVLCLLSAFTVLVSSMDEDLHTFLTVRYKVPVIERQRGTFVLVSFTITHFHHIKFFSIAIYHLKQTVKECLFFKLIINQLPLLRDLCQTFLIKDANLLPMPLILLVINLLPFFLAELTLAHKVVHVVLLLRVPTLQQGLVDP